MKICVKSMCVAGITGLSCSSAGLADNGGMAVIMPKQIPPCPARFVTGGLLASNGTLWVIGEHAGIYKLDPEGGYQGEWFDANYYAGYPETNNFYGIAEDKQGRIWVGTDNQGVVVFNGVSWQKYDRTNGLVGERVFDIAVSPASGEVAIATSAGVTIYHPGRETWTDYTRAEGLVDDHVQCLAFTEQGDLWIGYGCGGVSVASPSNNYMSWKTVQAPWYWDKRQYVRQPAHPRGNGLPSNLCNAMTVGETGTVWVGTNSGLACRTGRDNWKFIRGEDYEEKNGNVYGDKVTSRMNVSNKTLLPEDYVTCLAETPDGMWVGTRRSGAVLLDPDSMNVKAGYRNKEKERSWDTIFPNRLTSLIPFPDGTVIGTTYGAGCVVVHRGTGKWKLANRRTPENVNHPSPADPPTEEQLAAQIDRLKQLNKHRKSSPVLFWKDDWSTQGNWCGRYGADYALLCAANAPWSDEVYGFPGDYAVAGAIGPKRVKNDFLRHWVETVNDRYNSNVLYCPTDATRCEAVWDDHGEAYPMTHDGPDVWVVARVPEGRHIVSLYFFNPNGHVRLAAYRDYLVEVRKPRITIPADLLMDKNGVGRRKRTESLFCGMREDEMGRALSAPVLARTRVKDMAGSGVYKKFIVDGSGYYFFRVCRNYSYNTEISGVFIERVDRNHPDNYWSNKGHYQFAGVYPQKPDADVPAHSPAGRILAWREACPFNTGAEISCYEKASLYLYRNALGKGEETLTGLLAWNLNEWNTDRKRMFGDIMKRSWEAKQERSPAYRSAQFMPNAPNVIPYSIDEVMAMDRLRIDWKQYLPGHGGQCSPPESDVRGILAKEIKRHELAMREKIADLKKRKLLRTPTIK